MTPRLIDPRFSIIAAEMGLVTSAIEDPGSSLRSIRRLRGQPFREDFRNFVSAERRRDDIVQSGLL
jgi:hypothetical protein